MQISGIERKKTLISASRRKMHRRWESLKRKLIPVPYMRCNDIRLNDEWMQKAMAMLGDIDMEVRDVSELDFTSLPSGKRILLYGYVHGMHAFKSAYAAIELAEAGNKVLYVGAHIGNPPWLDELISTSREVHAFEHGEDFLVGPLVHKRQPKFFLALLSPKEEAVDGRPVGSPYNVVYHSCRMEGGKHESPVKASED
jgi:hypothetical protein